MVFCVAFGCSNGDNFGKSFFSFPSKEKAKATKAVDQTSRSSQLDTDSVFSLIPRSFLIVRVSSRIQLFTSLCFKPGRQRLKKSTLTCPIIPTIFKRIWEIETKKRRSLPFQKRRNLEISRSDSKSNTKWWQEYVSSVDKYKVIMAQLRLVQILRKCHIYEWLL